MEELFISDYRIMAPNMCCTHWLVVFSMVWGGMFLLGFVISYWSARRTLHRVERITETVARIGTEDLKERLPEPVNSDEISRLAKTFNHMLDRLQASVNQLRTVTGSIAHDLKSPVTLIRGTLESALCNEGNDKWRDSVGEAIEDLDRLLQLLNTTLDLAEAEAGALHIDRRPVDFSDVVRQLVDIYQPAMAEHHHEVTTDLEEHVVVDADVTLLNRVVSNLLENELTHLPAGCRVNIRLRSQQGSAELVIEDNGPGFSPDIGGQVFKRFVKGKNSPGHGLGLAFVDAVAQAHGGSGTGLRPSGRRRRYNFVAASERAPSGISTTFLAGFENPSIQETTGEKCPRELCTHFAGDIRYRDRFVRIFRVRIRWSRPAAEEGFSRQFKNGSAVLGDNLEPCHFPHHGEIYPAEA